MPAILHRAILTLGFVTYGAGPTIADEETDDPLLHSVQSYFRETDPTKRSPLVAEIQSAADGSLERVLETLAQIQLWKPVTGTEETLEVILGDGRKTRIRVTPPNQYDPNERYPLILALGGDDDGDTFDQQWLTSMGPECFVARVSQCTSISFDAPANQAGDPPAWLRALRRNYHLDSDRVYLYGSGTGGDAAFLAAVMHADAFAGVIVREGMLDVPYPRELQELLLDNLRNTPLHLIWTRPELPPQTLLEGRDVRVAVANQAFMKLAQTAPSPNATGWPIRSTVLFESTPTDANAWAYILDARRRPAANSVSHRFRYPAQGHARFLRLGRFAGPVWEGDQIDIQAHPTADRSAYVTDVLQSKLASLAGRIDGQTIHIESTRCETVEILLHAGMLDFSKPIHIRYNGKRRFSDLVRPSIATVLEWAYTEWEFQRPVCVRLRVGRRGRVLPF